MVLSNHIVKYLEKKCIENENVCHNETLVNSPFYRADIPKIIIKDYIERLNRYMNCSSSCFVLSLLLIEKAMSQNTWLFLSNNTVHKYDKIDLL